MLGLAKLKLAKRAGGSSPPPVTEPTTLSMYISSYTTTSVTLVWTYTKGTSGADSRSYFLQQSQDNIVWTNANGFTAFVSSSPVTTFTVTGLSAGTVYFFRLTTDDDALFATAYITLIGSVPDIPTNIVVTQHKNRNELGRITLSWVAPANVGGLPVTGYEVARYIYPNTHAKIVQYSAGTTFTATDLAPGQDYYFQIRALNAQGAGEWTPENEVSGHSWGYNMDTFYANGTWTWPHPNSSAVFDVLIVGGGGGGGMGLAGGGGGGGEVWWYENLFLNQATTPTASVVVGAGGTPGSNGGQSNFGGLAARGGGAGGMASGGHGTGASGGSGGGGSKYDWGGGDPIALGGDRGPAVNAGFESASFMNDGGNGWEGTGSSIVTGGGGGGSSTIGKTESNDAGIYTYMPSLGGDGVLLEVSLGNYTHVGAGGGGAVFMRGSQTDPGQMNGGAGWGGGHGARINEDQVMISAPSPSGSWGAGGGGGASYYSAVYQPTSGYQGVVRIGYYY